MCVCVCVCVCMYTHIYGFTDSSVCKESTCSARDPGWIPGLWRSAGEEISYQLQYSWASLVAQLIQNLPAMQRLGCDPWVGKIPWRREWLLTPVFFPGEFHGQRSLAGYSPWGCRVGQDRATNTFTFIRDITEVKWTDSSNHFCNIQ